MIDLHCHILPRMDDGAQTTEDMVQMARAALEDGITTIVATPHHKNGRYVNKKQDIYKAVDQANIILQQKKLDITILAGQECRLYGELIEDYHRGDILPLNTSNYLFVELPSGEVPMYTADLLYNIQLAGLVPVIVHPERNRVLIEHPGKLYDLVKNGALTQVTAASITGHFGKKIKAFSEEIIDSNLAHFIASDAHNITNRSFQLKKAYETINKEFGESFVYFYMENAELLIDNKHVMVEQPNTIRRRKKLFGLF
ncbi:tyrosine-protein phosphatase [Evansella tamaricis]|uniref:Tyrosine-protein phosphatase n=1 Tax=Evansella tamaricis TaxID=2069301 RepID=A0ABS6JKZ2_9BACI|nr:CpsB/CapC family capsule biosynthesis tyrosine phosphatase [Evansella tamaricis]MBU9713497.1 tyrosine protein phosphatase [Evansella tamaricis]